MAAVLVEESFLPGNAVPLELLHRDFVRAIFSCELKPHGGRLWCVCSEVLKRELVLCVPLVLCPVKGDRIELHPVDFSIFKAEFQIGDVDVCWVPVVLACGLDPDPGDYSARRIANGAEVELDLCRVRSFEIFDDPFVLP